MTGKSNEKIASEKMEDNRGDGGVNLLRRLGHQMKEAVWDDDGALTTEMMILTAVLAGVAIAAAVLLMGAMTDAANQIDVNTTVN